jgi:hypothetical protein
MSRGQRVQATISEFSWSSPTGITGNFLIYDSANLAYT